MPASLLPTIDFRRIRADGPLGTQPAGFEELASTLIVDGAVDWPPGVRFERFGWNDGGREGRGVLSSGEVWAWQTKYLFGFDAAAANQVHSSLKRALERDPDLRRYLVCFPIDLSAGDTAGRTSAHTRWTQKCSEWQAEARAAGRDIEIVFVGEHDLRRALTLDRHAGRLRYWFDATVMTREWQQSQIQTLVDRVGPRYTPDAHVEVATTQALDALGRTPAYIARWRGVLADVRSSRERWHRHLDSPEWLVDPLSRATDAVAAAAEAIATMIAALTGRPGPLPTELEHRLQTAEDSVWETIVLLQDRAAAEDDRHLREGLWLLEEALVSRTRALGRARFLAVSAIAASAATGQLLLIGKGGSGKTHLLCDGATTRVAADAPTVMILGQDFGPTTPLLAQIPQHAELGVSLDELLSVLDAAAEAAQQRGVLIIDAINESLGPERWRDDLRALARVVARYPHVGLVVSCRSEYLDMAVGDTQLPTVEHVGFAGRTDAAIQRYAAVYGFEAPSFPIFSPEFENPLFLKLACEAAGTLGDPGSLFGVAGIQTVLDAFLCAVNTRLSAPQRCDFDPNTNLVAQAVRQLAGTGKALFDRQETADTLETILPGKTWSKSLMLGLLTEGVLIDLGEDRIGFGYQRLGDLFRALDLVERSKEEVTDWLQGLITAHEHWGERGLLEALAVVLPEVQGVELVELVADEDGGVDDYFVAGFEDSLLMRSPGSVSAQTVGIVERLLEQGSVRIPGLQDHLLRIACIPDHPLGADWLHRRLAGTPRPERDRAWSVWLIGAADPEENFTARRMIDWVRLRDPQQPPLPTDVARAACLLLGWFLATPDRRVRDCATKALVALGERTPEGLAQAITDFTPMDDPYVLERLAAAACSVSLRTSAPEVVTMLADAVAPWCDPWPDHLLTRDYLRRILERAAAHGWSVPAASPPYGAPLPAPTMTREQIEAMSAPPDRNHSSIWHSLTGFGDFGRYVLRAALERIDTPDGPALTDLAERWIFERVLELGWTPELFKDIDRRLSRGRGTHSTTERVGKKYQWIAFYELLGRLVDHYPITRYPSDEETEAYRNAEQLVWRDMDPTVLIATADHPRSVAAKTFPATEPRFPRKVTRDYPDDLTGAPDLMKLVGPVDDSGTSWLALRATPSWDQELPPETLALRVPQRHLSFHITAYLVPGGSPTDAQLKTVVETFEAHRIPEAHSLLLGAHPWAPEWAEIAAETDAYGPAAALGWVHCVGRYGGTGTDRDASDEAGTTGYVPLPNLHRLLDLRSGVDFTWQDDHGLAIHDADVVGSGAHGLLMRRDLVGRLADAGLALAWAVTVRHELHTHDFDMPGDDYRWVEGHALLMLHGDEIHEIHRTAAYLAPGPQTLNAVQWQ